MIYQLLISLGNFFTIRELTNTLIDRDIQKSSARVIVHGDNVGLDEVGSQGLTRLVAPTLFSDWQDETGTPYPTRQDLLDDLNARVYDDPTATDAAGPLNAIQFNSPLGSLNGSANFTFDGSDVNLLDNITLSLGTGNDLVLLHDGTDSLITSNTGDLLFNNTNVNGTTKFALGSNISTSRFTVVDDSDVTLFDISGTGTVGIGTAASSIPLEILTTSTNGLSIESSNAARIQIGLNSTAVGGDLWLLASTADADITGGGNFRILNVDTSAEVIITSTGSMGLGTQAPNASSILDLTSTTTSFLMPRMTTVQRDAIASPLQGSEVYDLTLNEPVFFNGSSWVTTGESAAVGPINSVQFNSPLGSFNGSSNFVFDGTNVGIGESSPQNLLHVKDGDTGNVADPNSPIILESTTLNTFFTFLGNNSNNMGFLFGNTVNNADGGILYLNPTRDMIFKTGGNVTRMTLNSSGSLGIGTQTPDASSILDLTSTTQGILLPRMTTTERDLIASPATGLEIFNLTTNHFEFFNASAWVTTGTGAAGGLDRQFQFNNAGILDGTSAVVLTTGNTLIISPNSTAITGADNANKFFIRDGANTDLFFVNTVTNRIGIGDTGGSANINEKFHVSANGGTSSYTSGIERGILITDSIAPALTFEDTGESANEKVMSLEYSSQNLKFFALNDIGDTVIHDNMLVMNHNTGNVSIGTTPNATYLFEVENDFEDIAKFKGTGVQAFGRVTIDHNAIARLDFSISDTPVFAVRTDLGAPNHNYEIENLQTSHVNFHIDGDNDLIGINNNNPRSALHVITKFSAGSTYTGTDRGIIVTDDVSPRLLFDDSGEAANDKIIGFENSDQNLKVISLSDAGAIDSDNIMVWNRDGDVGIGTVPTETFHISGATSHEAIRYDNTATANVSNIIDSDYFLNETTTGLVQALRVRTALTDISTGSSTSGYAVATRLNGNLQDVFTCVGDTFSVVGAGGFKTTQGRFKGMTSFNVNRTTALTTRRSIYNLISHTGDTTLTISTSDIASGSTSTPWTFTVQDTSGTLEENGRKLIIATEGIETINGQSTLEIATDNGSVTIIADGSNALFTTGSSPISQFENILFAQSTAATQGPVATDTNYQIEFGAAQGGASDPVQLSAAGAVTINESGEYHFIFLGPLTRAGTGGTAIIGFRVLVNAVQVSSSFPTKLPNSDTEITINPQFDINLAAGDIVTFEIVRDSSGVNEGNLTEVVFTAAGWSTAPSARLIFQKLVRNY